MSDDDPIQSFLALHEQSDTAAHIPPPRRRAPACCCGNDACAYLKHTQTALDELERDVDTAARLGKALLVRHEAYITESEKERRDMVGHIESLEADKQSLEKKNATVIEENRILLDQLESLNNAVADSDTHVTGLQATLASTQREMQKLTQLAARTENLERQLAEFEREQVNWQSSLEVHEQSERSAVRRWQTAERTLAQLQEQMEQIEQEAKAEKERHAEIVGRMERRHAVEKELGSAAGRLKGAAALKNGDTDSAGGNGVVSHFVKDILQDNANLQLGIVELREMLNNSNDEVENLRSQLSLHQPSGAEEGEETPHPPPAPLDRQTLGLEMNRTASQELHVHHHYHAPPAPASGPKASQALRRPRRKRYSAFQSTPPGSGTSTPRSSFSYSTPTSTAAILQQTAASVPAPTSTGRQRWSMQSNQTFYSMHESSGPSSPQSGTHRSSSVFERVFSDAGHDDSSRPTTPDTEEPGSPVLASLASYVAKRGGSAAGWGRTSSAPVVQRHGILLSSSSAAKRPSLDAIMSIEELPRMEDADVDEEGREVIPEEGEDEVLPLEQSEDNNAEWENETSSSSFGLASPLSDEMRLPQQPDQRPDLSTIYTRPPLRRRANSHESLLSVSGMDIHTLKSRPSQLLAPYASRALTSQAVLSDTTAHAARPVAMSRTSETTGRSLLSGVAAEGRQAPTAPAKPTLGRKVGGWLVGKWGVAPAPMAASGPSPSTAAAAAPATAAEALSSAAAAANVAGTGKKAATASSAASSRSGASARNVSAPTAATAVAPAPAAPRPASAVSAEKAAPASLKPPKVRSPGINQDGPLLGFFPEIKALPTTPVVRGLDEEALRNVLGG